MNHLMGPYELDERGIPKPPDVKAFIAAYIARGDVAFYPLTNTYRALTGIGDGALHQVILAPMFYKLACRGYLIGEAKKAGRLGEIQNGR